MCDSLNKTLIVGDEVSPILRVETVRELALLTGDVRDLSAECLPEIPGGFDLSLYGTPIGYYSMAQTLLADTDSVSRFEELTGAGPVMDAPAASYEGVYVEANESVNFDGSDYYAPTTLASSFDALHQTSGTVACRFYNDGVANFRALIGSSNTNSKNGITVWRRSNTLRFILGNATTGLFPYNASSSAVVPTGWVNAIWTWDASNVQFYLEGALIGTVAAGSALPAGTAATPCQIGQTGGSWPWLGEIKKLMVLSTKTTSAASIAALQAELAA